MVDIEHLGAYGVPVAELAECLGASGGGVHAALDEAPYAHVDVECELRVDVALDAMRSELEAEEPALAGRRCFRSPSCGRHRRCRAECAAGDLDEAVPGRAAGLQPFAAGSGEAVVLRLAVVVRDSPLGLDEAAPFEAVERGVERAFADEERGVGGLLDPFDDGVAVSGSPAQGFEDEEIERAAHEADVEVVHLRRCGRWC